MTTDARVWSVTGRLGADELGLVLPHEHVISDFVPPGGFDSLDHSARPGTTREFYDAPLAMRMLGAVSLGSVNRDNLRLDDRAHAVRDLAAFAEHGGTTLVDLTPADAGRDPRALRSIADETGVHIVMGCGRYGPAGTPVTPDALVRELTDGVDGVRAGAIGEIGPLDPRDGAARAVLVAAAEASAQTGAPIWLRRAPDMAVTLAGLDVLAAAGADPSRVAVGHCDQLAPDPDALAPLLERGVYVAFDRLGRLPSVYSVHDDQDVATAVVKLAQQGHADRLLLSSAVSAKSDLLSWGGGGYAFIPQQFLGMLRMFGAGDELVHTITVDNPSRWLTGVAR